MAVKKSCIFLVIFFILATFMGIHVFLLDSSAQYQDKLNKVDTLVLTNNPDYTATIVTKGNTVSGSGIFLGDVVSEISLANDTGTIEKKTDFKGDGTFSFSLTQPYHKGSGILSIYLESGATLSYRLEYDNGWFFGDNGYGKRGEDAIEKRTVAPAQAAVLYLAADGEKETVQQTLDSLSALSKEITQNIPSDDLYEKAKAIALWVSQNIYYDRDAAKTLVTNETVALSQVLKTHRTVCAGYANIYSALLEAAGIQSVNLKGSTTTGGVTYEEFDLGVENHEWVAFWYPKQERWVYTDCTWDSGLYYEKGQYHDKPNKQKFFDITPLALSFDHRIDRAQQRFYFEALSYFDEQAVTDVSQTQITTSIVEPVTDELPSVSVPVKPSQSKKTTDPYIITIGVMILVIVALIIIIVVRVRRK